MCPGATPKVLCDDSETYRPATSSCAQSRYSYKYLFEVYTRIIRITRHPLLLCKKKKKYEAQSADYKKLTLPRKLPKRRPATQQLLCLTLSKTFFSASYFAFDFFPILVSYSQIKIRSGSRYIYQRRRFFKYLNSYSKIRGKLPKIERKTVNMTNHQVYMLVMYSRHKKKKLIRLETWSSHQLLTIVSFKLVNILNKFHPFWAICIELENYRNSKVKCIKKIIIQNNLYTTLNIDEKYVINLTENIMFTFGSRLS